MRLFVITRNDSDNCTYCCTTTHSIWTDEIKCLNALEEMKRRYPENKDHLWWDVCEVVSDPEHLDEYGIE